MAGEWATPIRQLYEYLARSEEQFSLLRKIDSATTDLDKSLEDLVFETTQDLARVSDADAASFYVDRVTNHVLAFSTGDRDSKEILSGDILSEGKWIGQTHPMLLLTPDTSKALTEEFPTAGIVLVIPVFVTTDEKLGHLFLQSSREAMRSRLSEDAEQSFVEAVGLQLSNSVRFRETERSRGIENSLSATFFANGLEPRKCFKEIVKYVTQFLPDFGPLRIEPAPEAQILLCDEGKSQMRIVATSGEEPDITLVDVDDSFCGRLIRHPDMPYYLDDPRNDPLYKFYLNKKIGKEILTELALPLRSNGRTIAILNLESEFLDAFKLPHVMTMQIACAAITPMVNALKLSMETLGFHQVAVVSALDAYLDEVGSTLRHGTSTPASTVGLRIGLLRDRIEDTSMKTDLDVIERNFQQVVSLVDDYIANIERFSRFDRYGIREIVDGAVSMNLPEQLERERIHIEVLPGTEIDVYSSMLLRHYLFDVIRNAVYSIKQRFQQNGDEPRGQIQITILAEEPSEEGQENDLNKRCRIKVRDNGLGTSKEVLSKIGQDRFSTKTQDGGTGLGLFALRTYVETIGGAFSVDSEESEYFEVSILLDQFDPARHLESGVIPVSLT